MEIEILKRTIKDQRSELEKKLVEERITKREYLSQVLPFLRYPNILAILGVRRCGKSFFSYLLGKELGENWAYINFDDERLLSAKTEDLDKILQAFYELYGEVKVIILDEIQNVTGWELFVSRLRNTKKVIITGSNSKLLSGELATHLTGRYIDFTLFPFSFREKLDFKPDLYLTEDLVKVRISVSEYLNGSGFPEFGKFGSAMVVNIYSDIITKDCIKRHNIRNEATFRQLAHYLLSNFSAGVSYSKLSRVFGVKDVHTVKNYVDYMKEAFLIVVLEKFSPKLKQQVLSPKKVYAIDHGLSNFAAFALSPNKGKIMENIVCIELFRRKAVNRKWEIYYWKGRGEIDFVVKEGIKVKQLIQVCYDLSDPFTKEREIKSLVEASVELRCKNGLVITSEFEGEEKHDGLVIKFIPLWRWLLDVN